MRSSAASRSRSRRTRPTPSDEQQARPGRPDADPGAARQEDGLRRCGPRLLLAHPAGAVPPGAVRLYASAKNRGDALAVHFRLVGDLGELLLPARLASKAGSPAQRGPVDGLWRTTCFEIFAASDPSPMAAASRRTFRRLPPESGAPAARRHSPAQASSPAALPSRDCTSPTAYAEWNLSPSGAWAAYVFDAKRRGMRAAPLGAAPRRLVVNQGANRLDLYALLPVLSTLGSGQVGLRVGPAAVLDFDTRGQAYLALRHASFRPDFHDPVTRTIRLAGRQGAGRWRG